MNELDKIFSDPTTPAPSAPAAQNDSITIKVWHPLGFDTLLTLRGGELLPRYEKAISWLVDHGYSPTPTTGSAAPAPTNGTNGAAPVCPTHQTPMKPSQHGGGWYCPQKIADNDGTGKPVYCKQKA